jgi:hypothetical protein
MTKHVYFSSGSLVICAFCGIAALLLSAFSVKYQHWFMLPVTLCGIISIADFALLLRRDRTVKDPALFVGLYLIYLLFVSPLLHVHFDYWLEFAPAIPEDTRDWFGLMACFNCVGIVAYIRVRNACTAACQKKRPSPEWLPNFNIVRPLLLFAIVGAGIAQFVSYQLVGGVSGYVALHDAHQKEAWSNLGLLFAFSECFPILVFMALCLLVVRRRPHISTHFLIIAVGVVFLLALLFGGMRGSRTLVMTQVVWAAGIVHLTVRRLTKTTVLLGLCACALFLYTYGFYKAYGLRGIDYLTSDAKARAVAETNSGRSVTTLLLGDLSRSGVQAFTLYQLWKPGSEYSYGLGRSYVGAVAVAIPKWIWPSRPRGTVALGTDMCFGPGAFSDGWRATYVYGLTGEIMMNYSPWAIPLGFAVLGFIIARARTWVGQLSRRDMRMYIVPYVVLLCQSVVDGDADNMVIAVAGQVLLPYIIIVLGSRRVARPTWKQVGVQRTAGSTSGVGS